MPSIVLKLQSCGKETCSCRREGKLHGPYFWLVTYKKGTNGQRGRYVWKYLGKRVDQVVKFIVTGTEPGFLGRKSLKLLEREIERKVNEFFDNVVDNVRKNDKRSQTHPLVEDLDQWLEATVQKSTASLT